MNLFSFGAFMRDLCVAIAHEIRSRYYEVAHNHSVAKGHPDAWMLCNRMLTSRAKVDDFLARWAR